MSIYRYMPNWREVRDELRQNVAALDDEMALWQPSPALPNMAGLIARLAAAQASMLAWAKNPGAQADTQPASQGLDDAREVLYRVWGDIETWGGAIAREVLTQQHPHPSEKGRSFSYYQIMWEMLRREIACLAQLELMIEAWQAENDRL